MKVFKQKKGMVLILILAVLFVFGVLLSLFIRMENKKSQFPKTLGEIQMSMLGTYQEAEKALFFIDQAAKYSAEQAIYELGQTGGFQDVSDCGYYYDYVLWNNEDKECYPNGINNKFAGLINDHLNNYLQKYTYVIMPLDNYNYLVKSEDDKTIVYGFATINLNLDVKKWKQETSRGETEADERKEQLYFDQEITDGFYRSFKEDKRLIASKIVSYAKEAGIEPALALAVAEQESSFNPEEISSTGCVGLFQICSWEICRDNMPYLKSKGDLRGIQNLDKNIQCGMIILKQKYKEARGGKSFECTDKYYEEWDAALRGYNTWGCKGADLNFVEKVNEKRNSYRKMIARANEMEIIG